MRIDKFIAKSLGISRKQATQYIKSNQIKLNDKFITKADVKICAQDLVFFNQQQLTLGTEFYYLMLNKPKGYECSHNTQGKPSVYQLIEPDLRQKLGNKLHSIGRLDIDTTGLLILTNDGEFSHKISSPKHKIGKTYVAKLAQVVDLTQLESFKTGVMLRGEDRVTLPASYEVLAPDEVELTINQGLYHQVKRMFGAIGNRVVALNRISIGNLQLDQTLALGQYRNLTDDEIKKLELYEK